MLGEFVEWISTTWGAVSAILGTVTIIAGVLWKFRESLAAINPYSRISQIEDRLDYQEEFAQTEARIVEVERKLDQHERECLRTRRENGERLSRLEQKADHHSDKLNRIEGLIEGLKEAIRD